MPALEWVIDTCVLGISQDPGDDRALDALGLLHSIKSSHKLAVNIRRQIPGEYFRHAPAKSHAGQWLRLMLSRADKCNFYPANLAARHKRNLDGLGFDKSDVVFVATAAETADKLLVSEDSDYNPEVTKYLSEQIGVAVLDIRDSVRRAHRAEGA